ncbi:MAG: hypothetical protein QGG36_31205 [Pirellulaceae bacterium]|nr:hypothetical protein [Pirellulaceae bacterium]
MARRENQGLQIALIIFVILTLLLCITTYVFYRQSEEAKKQFAQSQEQLNTSKAAFDLAFNKAEWLKYFVGAEEASERTALDQNTLPKDDELNTLIAKFDRDMQQWRGLDRDTLNYGNLPEKLIAAVRDRNNFARNLETTNLDLQVKVTKTIEDQTARATEAIRGQQTLAEDLAKRTSTFETDRTSLNTKIADRAKRIATVQNELTTTQEAALVAKEEASKDINELEIVRAMLAKKLESLGTENFEMPDGKITWVNQRQNVLWINLGSTDGLRPQTTFSVYEHDSNGVANEETKGRIEVTRIIKGHLAEARILEDEVANPILPGDLIHTAAWQPGRRLRFAMVGVLDIDNDDRTDNALVRRIITMNGGLVDQELTNDGKLVGDGMSVNTRYIIKGPPPISPSGQVDDDVLAAYTDVITRSQRLGISEISLDEFLNYMGWKATTRTVPLGKYTGNRASQSRNEELKQQRREPPARGGDGAF